MPGWEFLVDSREKRPFKDRVKAHGITYRETALDADFVLRRLRPEVKDEVGFERKAVADLVQSIGQKSKKGFHYQPRLFEQARRMSKLFDVRVLVISGDLNAYKTNLYFKTGRRFHVHESVIWGSLSSVFVRYGVNVVWLPDDDALIEFVYRTCVKVSEGKLGLSKDPPKYMKYDAKQMLATIPGITHRVAGEMLKKFITLRGVATARAKELETIDGIGPVTADSINKFFRKKY